jgi:hypothetical protein
MYFDRAHTVDIALISGTLASVPEADLLNGSNAALLGAEIIQFANAELIGENTYRLSVLLRGRRGTDWAVNMHAVEEQFILLQSGIIKPEPMGIDKIGRLITYRYAYLRDSDGTNIDFKHTGCGYKPYSVCHVKGVRSGGDLTISWVRRTRIGGAWRDGVDALLSEPSERYDVEIIAGEVVKRMMTVTASSVVYTKAQQIADFGSVQEVITVRIYQLSDKVGRGYAKEAVL